MPPSLSRPPLVSVLMTMYNADTHLRAAVESILNQTMRDFELIIVDDGSTDESVALMKNWDDPRIRLIQNPVNKGQTLCLNQGLALARGNWVARQDADDISLPSRLETQINAVTKNPGLTLIGSQAWIIDHAGKFEGTLNLPLEMESLEWASLFENPFVHTAVMYRRDQITNLGGYDESFAICQDYELWLRILRIHRGINLSARLVQYRHTAQSLSQSGRSTVDAECWSFVRRGLHALRLPPCPSSSVLSSVPPRSGPESRFPSNHRFTTCPNGPKYLRQASLCRSLPLSPRLSD